MGLLDKYRITGEGIFVSDKKWSSHQQYLEHMLRTNKQLLKNADIQHQISIARYNKEVEMLQSQIDSISNQLERTDESGD